MSQQAIGTKSSSTDENSLSQRTNQCHHNENKIFLSIMAHNLAVYLNRLLIESGFTPNKERNAPRKDDTIMTRRCTRQSKTILCGQTTDFQKNGTL